VSGKQYLIGIQDAVFNINSRRRAVMGQPAARATIDTSAHTGSIQSGSPNVMIGGFPAARKGDTVSCSTHGSGVIIGGSGSVFVNGRPLARLGDETQCNASSSPTSAAPKPAAAQYWGGTLANKAGEDGMRHSDNYDARVLGAYASMGDKNLNGDLDTASAGFALSDITTRKMKSNDVLSEEIRIKLAVANATGSLYGGGNDIYGLNTDATATGLQYGASAAVGKEKWLYGEFAEDVTIGTAEAKAILEVYTGNKGRYGLTAEVGAEEKAIKAEGMASVDILGFIIADVKGDVNAGSAEASIGGSAYWDINDYSANVRVTGGLATAIGLEGDASIKVVFGRVMDLIDYIWGHHDMPAAALAPVERGDGTIITGCVTVLVGD
jgi:uncharacterized Zn-binding protein involved in type VI secretion